MSVPATPVLYVQFVARLLAPAKSPLDKRLELPDASIALREAVQPLPIERKALSRLLVGACSPKTWKVSLPARFALVVLSLVQDMRKVSGTTLSVACPRSLWKS